MGRKAPFDLRGLNVLIVDDDADTRDPLEATLDYCGALATPASSARAALAWLEARQPDLIVSDPGMPGENGQWFIRQVRGLSSPVSTIPAVALTGFDGLRYEAEAAGFNAYLVKPFEVATFSEALQRDSRLANRALSKNTEGRPKNQWRTAWQLPLRESGLKPYLGEDQVHATTGEQARPSGTSDLSAMRPSDFPKRRCRAHGRLHDPRLLRASATVLGCCCPDRPVTRAHRRHPVTGATPAVAVKEYGEASACDGCMRLKEDGPQAVTNRVQKMSAVQYEPKVWLDRRLAHPELDLASSVPPI